MQSEWYSDALQLFKLSKIPSEWYSDALRLINLLKIPSEWYSDALRLIKLSKIPLLKIRNIVIIFISRGAAEYHP